LCCAAGCGRTTDVPRVALPLPSKPGRCYAMDFAYDRLAIGRRFKCLARTELCSKEVPVIEVDKSIGGEHVCRILDRFFADGPLPEIVILDKGQEFSGTSLDAWAAQHGVSLHIIQTGKPVRNTFLDDCLNKQGFLTFQDGQVVLEVWRQEYNAERAHSAIEDMTPTEYSTLS